MQVIHCVALFLILVLKKSTYWFANVKNYSRNVPKRLRKTVVQHSFSDSGKYRGMKLEDSEECQREHGLLSVVSRALN